jgi:hypothetical protein
MDQAGVTADRKPVNASCLSGQPVEMKSASSTIAKAQGLKRISLSVPETCFAFQPQSQNSSAVFCVAA